MQNLLSLAFLALAAFPPQHQAPKSAACVRRLEESSLSLCNPVAGGTVFTDALPGIQLGFDRNRHRYLAVIQARYVKGNLGAIGDSVLQDADGNFSLEATGDPIRICVAPMTREEFRAILDGVAERGINELPLEQPAQSEDIYALNTSLEVHYRDFDWHNRVTAGRVQSHSTVRASDSELERFAEIVAYVVHSVEGLEFRAGGVVDEFALPKGIEMDELPRFRAMLDAAYNLPNAPDLNLNRTGFDAGSTEKSISFPYRAMQPLRSATFSESDWAAASAVLTGSGRVQVRVESRFSGIEADRLRRFRFVADHPNLPGTIRDAILAGWIQSGMTCEMVMAAWGEPREVGRTRDPSGCIQISFDSKLHPFQVWFDSRDRVTRM